MALNLQPRLSPNPALAKAALARPTVFGRAREEAPAHRVRSLDALRGFDMLWIIGADAVAEAAKNLSANHATRSVLLQFYEHVPWIGLRFYDVIFPLFVVIMGVALPHSIGARLELGESRKCVLLKVLRRTALLIALGLVYNGLFSFQGWDHLRLFGVLQRLGLVYCATSMLMIFTHRKTQAAVGIGLLLLYWMLMWTIPVPGVAHGTLTPFGNAANYVDRLVLLPHQMYKPYGDPEGLLSTLPAIASCLLGLFAGYWLQSDRSAPQKAAGLAIGAVTCVALGLLWMPFFPVIKNIWTSSFVLLTGGASLALLTLFYWLIDVRGWAKWAVPLVVIGMNPLLIYLLPEAVDFEGTAGYFLNGPLHNFALYQALGIAVGALALKWLLLYFLYRQRVFVKI